MAPDRLRTTLFGGRPAMAELGLLVTVSIWGLVVVATKVGLASFAPLVFVIARFWLGGVVTLAFVLPRGGLPRFERRDLRALGLAAFLGVAVNQFGFVTALRLTSAVNTSLLLGTIALWASLVSVLFGVERPGKRHWLGVGVGVIGVSLIVLGGRADATAGSIQGDLMALVAALAWGAYTVLIRPLRERYSAISLSLFTAILGTAMLLPVALPEIAAQPWSDVSAIGVLALVFAAVPGVALTNVIYFNAIKAVGPSRAAVYTYLIPFVGAMLAVVLLGEHASIAQLVGGIAVVLAVAVSKRDPWNSVVPR